jgi:hypothetical protein
VSWNPNHEATWQITQLEEAKRRYQDSEWILNILRTLTVTPTTPATNEEILLWNKQLNSNQN